MDDNIYLKTWYYPYTLIIITLGMILATRKMTHILINLTVFTGIFLAIYFFTGNISMAHMYSLFHKNLHNQEFEIIQVTGSSELINNEQFTFEAEFSTDKNPNTWWSPYTYQVPQSWLKVEFKRSIKLNGISIHAGANQPNYKNSGLNAFQLNARIKKGKITFSNGEEYNFELENINKIQKINFPEVETEYLILGDFTLYPGDKWQDLCIF